LSGAYPSSAWVERYLSLLGVRREAPALDALTRLVRAHGETSVFENVTAILRRARAGLTQEPVPPIDYEELLTARAERRGGGVCFEHAPMFRRLLAELGYRVQPILAQISFPGSHHATIVDFEEGAGARYLVDVGSGAPLWQPIRLGETIELQHAGLGYRFHPEGAEGAADGGGGFIQERRSDEGWQQSCRYDLRPADAATIEAAYQRHQLPGETWVVGNITMVRCTEAAVHRLRDDELVSHTASGKVTQRLTTPAEYRQVAADIFGLPHLPIEEALITLDEIRRTRAT